jgi:hypothetical protein
MPSSPKLASIANATQEEVEKFLNDTFELDLENPLWLERPIYGTAGNDMKDYARLAKFLSNEGDVAEAAAKLAGLLGGFALSLNQHFRNGMSDPFLEVLRNLGVSYRFNPTDYYTLDGQVVPEGFRWVVSKKSFFHDAFTRPHGEYTHAVQWLLMAVRFESSDLNARIADLYARSVAYISKEGKQFITRLTKDGKPIYERIYLWNFLVDCFPGPDENYKANIRCQTYRCPQYVTNKFVGLSPESWLGRHLIRLRWLGCNRGEPPPSPRYDRKRLKKGNISYTPRDIAENLQSGLWEQTGYPNVYRVVPPRILVH